jgi:hypothetical protein
MPELRQIVVRESPSGEIRAVYPLLKKLTDDENLRRRAMDYCDSADTAGFALHSFNKYCGGYRVYAYSIISNRNGSIKYAGPVRPDNTNPLYVTLTIE